MLKKQEHDVITHQQELFRIIRDEKILKYFDSKNYGYILKFLRKGPMTKDDLEIAFKEEDEEKSTTSLYRYLQQLGKAGLVIQGGKRISTDEEGQTRVQTLFMRTSKIFFIDIALDPTDREKINNIVRTIKFLLEQRASNKICSEVALNALITKLHQRRQEVLEETLTAINGSNLDLFAALNWLDAFNVLDIAFWVVLLTEGSVWQKDLATCFTEK
jgi:DNA-binding PadR family transcriptional regulator